jgi:hypothetical protein
MLIRHNHCVGNTAAVQKTLCRAIHNAYSYHYTHTRTPALFTASTLHCFNHVLHGWHSGYGESVTPPQHSRTVLASVAHSVPEQS